MRRVNIALGVATVFVLMVMAATLAFGQSYGITPGTGGGGGFPVTLGTTPITANSTTTALLGISALNNIRYMSCASELGAQINTAVTSLGATGGTIVLPNCTSATMTTTATSIPPQISIVGYGTRATIITCSVAGDCIQTVQNPTTQGSIGGVIENFQIDGSGASNQVLMHMFGASGYTLHDLEFEGFGTGGAATCLEFDTFTTGGFVERNVTYNVNLERTCTIGVLFNSQSPNFSFGHNEFFFNAVSTGANYAIVFNGNGQLYNGTLNVHSNHVGPGGGIVQFNGSTSTAGVGNATAGENMYLTAEEDGSGAGILLSNTGSGVIYANATIINGSAAANPMATAISNTGAGSVVLNCVNSAACTVTSGNITTAGAGTFKGGVVAGPSGVVGNIANFTNDWTFGTNFVLKNTSANGQEWDEISEGSGGFAGVFALSNTTTWPFLIYDNNVAAPQIETVSNGEFAWSTTTTGGIPNANINAGLSSPASGVVSVDSTTPANSLGQIKAGSFVGGTFVPPAARKGTFVCTAAGTITITNANELATSNVEISMNTAGGTITTPPAMKTVTAGTGFTVLCGATDTSTYNYVIFN